LILVTMYSYCQTNNLFLQCLRFQSRSIIDWQYLSQYIFHNTAYYSLSYWHVHCSSMHAVPSNSITVDYTCIAVHESSLTGWYHVPTTHTTAESFIP